MSKKSPPSIAFMRVMLDKPKRAGRATPSKGSGWQAHVTRGARRGLRKSPHAFDGLQSGEKPDAPTSRIVSGPEVI